MTHSTGSEGVEVEAAARALLALVERLSAATGPDRELDVAILTTVLGYRDIHGDGSLFDRGNDGYWTFDGDENNRPLPSPTSSLDAALTLVPEGWQWLSKSARPRVMSVYDDTIDYDATKTWAVHIDGAHANPAIALCIAALKARAALARAAANPSTTGKIVDA